MRTILFLALVLTAVHGLAAGVSFRKVVLNEDHTSESANVGDFNGDGRLDVVAGSWWYEGPDLGARHAFKPARIFDSTGYSDTVQPCFVGDFNDDGWADIFQVVRQGSWKSGMHWQGRWYENPGKVGGFWREHEVLHDLMNESTMFADIDGDGAPEVLSSSPVIGYGTITCPGREWIYTSLVTGEDKVAGKKSRFGARHGMGHGDINGDGRIDMTTSGAWYERPEMEGPWIKHPHPFAKAAAQMFVKDLDGDGLKDVATVWDAHGYGLVWHRQLRGADGGIHWTRHDILSPEPRKGDLKFSQLHALAMADLNNDGREDLVTGKRFWAHGPTGDVDPDHPAVLYWFEQVRRNGQVAFVPHLIDDDSGVGCQIRVADLDGDGKLDIVTSNKKGTFLFLNTGDE